MTKASSVDDTLYREVGNYLLNSETWVDCYFLVGRNKERIGAVRSALVNHGQVWWSMLSPNSSLVEKGDITLPDIEPDVFRLLLKYMYGGLEDFSSFPEDTVVQLCYCANKYLMTHLMGKISARLQPSSVDEVFTALHCVVYYNLCERAVKEIVQTKTVEIFAHPEFLGCDVESVTYIAKQDKLNCQELELWNAVINWARYQVIEMDCPRPNSTTSKEDIAFTNQMSGNEAADILNVDPDAIIPSSTMEDHTDTNYKSENNIEVLPKDESDERSNLRKWILGPLRHIRLLTLDVGDIYKHVFVCNVLELHEMVGICRRDIKDIKTLCNKTEKRGSPKINVAFKVQHNMTKSNEHFSLNHNSSSLIVVKGTSIRLESVTCKGHISNNCDKQKDYFFGFPLTVDIVVTIHCIPNSAATEDSTSDEEAVVIPHKAFPHFYAELFTIPTVEGGKGVVLLANSTYVIELYFSGSSLGDDYNRLPSWSKPDCFEGHDFEHGIFYCSLTYSNGVGLSPCHIQQFTYSTAVGY